MKPPDAHLHALGAELTSQIHPPRVLIALDADQRPQAPTIRWPDQLDNPLDPDARVGLIKGVEPNVHIAAEHVATSALEGEAIQDGEGVGGNRGANPLDDVAIVIIMRWLDHDNIEKLFAWRAPSPYGSCLVVHE